MASKAFAAPFGQQRLGIREVLKKPDQRHGRLLCAPRERPCRRSAAEKRDERAALQAHSITSSAVASSNGGIVRPSALAVFVFSAVINNVGSCTGKSAGFSPLRMRST
jgi:hypothetical protein